MTSQNLLLRTDSYKVTHWRQVPPGQTTTQFYVESRGGRFEEIIPFGLQAILHRWLKGVVFNAADIIAAQQFCRLHFGQDVFNAKGWFRMLEKHGGMLPLRIKALPEGTPIRTNHVIMTVENTDPEFPWLPSYLESLLLKVWYGTSVATLSYYVRRLIEHYYLRNGCAGGTEFKLHDFGYRGVSSEDSAEAGGAGHLVNFKGTDNIPAILFMQAYYGVALDEMPGFSVPAAEHSTITAWGQDKEVDAYRNMLEQYPEGIVSIVSDSYDILRACREIFGAVLANQIRNRKGVVVVRPDSGDPVPTVLSVLNALGEKFGTETNNKGYRVLPAYIRVLQGDGLNYMAIQELLDILDRQKWSIDNIATLGMGGGLLQKVDRDTQKFAMKLCANEINGEWQDVFKLAPGKHSKRGRLALLQHPDPSVFSTVREEELPTSSANALKTVFETGCTLNKQSLPDIRERAASKLQELAPVGY